MTFHEDWGQRCERWRGVRSEELDVAGTPVHVLRADGAVGAEEATGQLLVHGLGGAATNWLEALGELTRLGPVVAPDLPGFGRTPPPRPGASRVGTNARFLRALLDRLGWERAVVHGNSMGGMLAVLLGEHAPARVERLVLASPALPSRPGAVHRIEPRTLARFAPFVLPGLGRLVLRRLWSRASAQQLWDERVAYLHVDPTRVSPELAEVGLDNIARGQREPWRVEALATAAESLLARLVASGGLWRALEGLDVPGLVLWGEGDRLIGEPVFDELRRRRPDWAYRRLADVGHCPQIEVPGLYVETVVAWMADPAPLDA